MKITLNFSNNFQDIKSDIISGLSVSALSLPQTMAYALIAGLDPIYGLYTAIVAMISGAFIGVSNHLIIGPANIIALAIASSLSGYNGDNYLQAVLLLTFMVGLIQIMFSILKLGDFVNYISRSVIVGLTVGVSILIIIGQLENIFGIKNIEGLNILFFFVDFINNLPQTNLYALVTAFITIIIIILIKKFYSDLPEFLISIIVSIIFVYLLEWNNELIVVGEFPRGLPALSLIEFDFLFIQRYWTAAISTAMLGFIYTLSTVKALQLKTGQELDFNRVFLGQGLVNIICSFFSSFATAGSFTKSYANYQAGAKSKLSELIAGFSIIPVIIFFRPLGNYIPIPALGSLVIAVAISMVDMQEVKNCLNNKFDRNVMLLTFFATLLSPRLDYAILSGIIISFILVLNNSSNIKYDYFYFDYMSGGFTVLSFNKIKEKEYIGINIEGDINFISSNKLRKILKNSYKPGKKYIIRMRYVENIDLTAIKVLENFFHKVKDSKGEVLICGLNEDTIKLFNSYDLDKKIGKNKLFSSKQKVFYSTHQAIKKAAKI